MSKILSLDDIDRNVRPKIYTQNYSKKPIIEGVKIINLTSHVGEEGDLSEIIKVGNQGEIEGISGFKIAQVNRTRLNPGSIKAWHLHFRQDEVWYLIPSGELLVGLWDVRKDSSTQGITMKLVLGGDNSQLLFIPNGVAHGSVNFIRQTVELFYFVNQRFDLKNPDEHRIPWDAKGADFWTPQRD